MANSEDVLHQYAARLLAGGSTRQDDAALMERLAAEVRELRAKLDSEAGHRLSLCADNERFVAEVRELRQKLAEPWRHFPCPETQQPCGRMCLSMCHRRSDLIGELRRDRARLDWIGSERRSFKRFSIGIPFHVYVNHLSVGCGATLREAIDAAMGGGEGEA